MCNTFFDHELPVVLRSFLDLDVVVNPFVSGVQLNLLLAGRSLTLLVLILIDFYFQDPLRLANVLILARFSFHAVNY